MQRKLRATTQRRKRYRFTKEDCQRGYQVALAKCNESWKLAAWLFKRVRSHYRRKNNSS